MRPSIFKAYMKAPAYADHFYGGSIWYSPRYVAKLKQLCRDIYADLVDISEQDIEAAPAFKQVAERHQAAMKSFGLLEEE